MRLKLSLLNVVGNSIGAVLVFLYFSYVNVTTYQYVGDELSYHYIIYFIIGTGLIFLVMLLAVHRWSRPLNQFTSRNISINDLDAYEAEQLRRKALQMVPMTAAASFFGWLMAGFIFGMFMPIIMTALVSGSASKASRQSMKLVPGTGSPPMPTQVVTPMSFCFSSYSAW